MNPFVIAILKVVVIEALAGLIVASFFFDREDPRVRRWFDRAFVMIAFAGVVGYFNFGYFRYQDQLVNSWEHYHFFLGSKYLRELRYDGLYEASLVALDEIHPGSMDKIEIRSLKNFQMVAPRDVLVRAEEIKGRFSAARWRAFSRDAFFFFAELHLPADGVLQDHGNTGSPLWAMAAWPLTAPFSARRSVLTAISFADVLLLGLLFFTVSRCFGLRVMSIAMTVMLLVPRAYDFLGGSILRLDWLFALGMAACFLAVNKHRSAGVCMAWAIASKPFCALFALALGAKMVIDARRDQRVRTRHAELVIAATIALAGFVALSSLTRGGPGVWVDYGRRIMLNLEEKYYADNHSFRDVFLQVAHDGPAALVDWAPEPVAASLYSVDAADFKASLLLARLVIIGLFVAVMARHQDELFAFSLGAFWVYVVFATNMYYWQMLGLPTLAFAHGYRRDIRKLLYLLFACAFLMASYVMITWNLAPRSGLQGYFGSYWLALFCAFVFAVELWYSAFWPTRSREAIPSAAGIEEAAGVRQQPAGKKRAKRSRGRKRHP